MLAGLGFRIKIYNYISSLWRHFGIIKDSTFLMPHLCFQALEADVQNLVRKPYWRVDAG